MDIKNPWDYTKKFEIDFTKNKMHILGPISKEKMIPIIFTIEKSYIIKCKNFELEINLEEGVISKIVKSTKYGYEDSITFALQILFRLGIGKAIINDFDKISTFYIKFGFFPILNNNDMSLTIQSLLKKLYSISFKDFENHGLDEKIKQIHFANKNYQYYESPFLYICENRNSIGDWIKIMKKDGPGYEDLVRMKEILDDIVLVNPAINMQDLF